jgi:tetratricopeptide (TPR) repeat protein
LNQAIILDKKNVFADIVMGDAFLEENNGGMALTYYEKALEINPQSTLANFRIGQLYIRSRNSEESHKYLSEAIKTDSLFAPAYREMAELFNTMRKYDEAKTAYGKYLELSGNSTISTLTRYAYLLFKAKDYDATINIINLLQTMDSSNVVMNRFLGYSNFEQKKYAEGLKSMEAFFAKIDTSKILASDYEYYGKLLSKNKMDSMAVIYISKAIAMDTTEIDLYTDLGDAYKSWKKFDLAAAAYKTKIEKSRNGGDALACYKLGEAYYWNKQIDLADSAFTKVIELKPNLAIGYFWHARCLSKYPDNKYFNEAKDAYEKYLEIESASPKASKKDMAEANLFLGVYYVLNDDTIKAKEMFLKVLELDTENKDAKNYLEQMELEEKNKQKEKKG